MGMGLNIKMFATNSCKKEIYHNPSNTCIARKNAAKKEYYIRIYPNFSF